MKTFTALPIFSFAVALVLTGTACTKSHNDPAPPIAAISFIAASPDAPALNFNLDQNRVNYQAMVYTNHTGYLNAYPGKRLVRAFDGQTAKVTDTVNLQNGRFYSIFLAGKWANAKFILMQDSLQQPEVNAANVRFVNLTNGAPALDLGLGDTVKVISNRLYAQNSRYTGVYTGRTYQFLIREHGGSQVKFQMPNMTLTPGHSYTIWTSGNYTDSGNTGLTAGIVENY